MPINQIKKCPNCSSEMEQGYIGTPRYIKWLKNEKNLLTTSETIVHECAFRWENNKMYAARCKYCKIIIFEYPEMNREVDYKFPINNK